MNLIASETSTTIWLISTTVSLTLMLLMVYAIVKFVQKSKSN